MVQQGEPNPETKEKLRSISTNSPSSGLTKTPTEILTPGDKGSKPGGKETVTVGSHSYSLNKLLKNGPEFQRTRSMKQYVVLERKQSWV